MQPKRPFDREGRRLSTFRLNLGSEFEELTAERRFLANVTSKPFRPPTRALEAALEYSANRPHAGHAQPLRCP